MNYHIIGADGNYLYSADSIEFYPNYIMFDGDIRKKVDMNDYLFNIIKILDRDENNINPSHERVFGRHDERFSRPIALKTYPGGPDRNQGKRTKNNPPNGGKKSKRRRRKSRKRTKRSKK